MKKTLIALLALSSLALGETITLDSTFYSNPTCWVYVWNSSESKWQVSKSLTSETLVDNTSGPSAKDPVFYGYEFAYTNGVQTMTSTSTPTTLNAPTWWWTSTKGIYISENITSITGSNNGFRPDTKFHFADITTTSFDYTGGFWKQGNASVSGSLVMTDDTYEKVFFTASAMQQNDGIWDFSGFSVTDANGNALTYTTDAENIGKAGYFWVEGDYTQSQPYSAKLVAKGVESIPEPTTATLSLLALAGLAARRRRK